MSSISPLVAYPEPQIKQMLLDHYKGKHINVLPTPSLLMRESAVNDNVTRLLKRLEAVPSYRFRCHVKTHKTVEITKKQLGYGLPNYNGPKHSSIVISTLKEAYAIADYMKKSGESELVQDVVYGLPNITDEVLDHVVELQKTFKNFRLMIDNPAQLEIINKFNESNKITKPWSLFIKLDAGTARAGVRLESADDYKELKDLLDIILKNEQFSLFGFYVHAGHSYSSKTIEESEVHYLEELETVDLATKILEKSAPTYKEEVVVSVGATPTLHALEHDLHTETTKKIDELLANLNATLEVHAGNYPICDMQQVATGCVNTDNVAIQVLGTVISQYSKRKNPIGEILTNTGVIALSREPSPVHHGFGKVVTDPKYGEWAVDRCSQEHGVLAPFQKDGDAIMIPIGTKIKIIPNHACITANSYNAYYVVDDSAKIVDVYIPWRGW